MQIKNESIRQWSSSPCGAVYAGKIAEGTLDYFDAIKNYRYSTHKWILRHIDQLNVSGKSVLEVGCGIGIDAAALAERGAIVTGVDITPKVVGLASQLFLLKCLSGKFVIGDAENLPIASSSQDIVYSIGVLHHTPDIQRSISEMRRVLKPGGKVLVVLYHKNSWHYWMNLVWQIGIAQGKLSEMSIDELLSRFVECKTDDSTRPLVRVYTAKQCKDMFHGFKNVKISKEHWTREQIGFPVNRFLPVNLPRFLGWYIVVSATV